MTLAVVVVDGDVEWDRVVESMSSTFDETRKMNGDGANIRRCAPCINPRRRDMFGTTTIRADTNTGIIMLILLYCDFSGQPACALLERFKKRQRNQSNRISFQATI